MRRTRKWLLALAALVVGAAGVGAGAPARAQQAQIDSAFSSEIISTLGYPEVEIRVTPDGVEAPDTLPAGIHLVTLSTVDPYIAYVNFVQPPEGLSEADAIDQARQAAQYDLVQPGWVYAGGSNTPNVGETASFLIDLRPGDYQVAASYYAEGQQTDEDLRLAPLTVTAPGAAASPAAVAEATPVAAEPPATVTLEETDDLRYVVSPDPVPAGPQLWKIENTGQMHPHHVVMMRTPEGTMAQQIVDEFNGLVAGTPPAGDAVFPNQLVWVGYAALQSGGWTTWAEFDLEPATYAVICFIIDPETGRPHAADGMVTVFEVA